MKLDKYKLDKIIYKWVEKNYGESEALEPSWSIVELANHIAEQYDKPLEEEAEPYELTLLVRQDMSLKELDVLHNIIMKHFEDGDTWKKWENDGVKRLAYSIKGETHAGYFWVEGYMKRSEMLKLERFLENDDHVLRHLLVNVTKPKGE